MIAINSIIDKIVKKEDISSNNLNIFFLQCLGYTSDIKIYKECILDNEYVFEEDSEILENLYFKAKNIKNKFVSLINIWKWNKSVKYNSETDLYLNPLSNFEDKYKITIMENNTRYTFRLSDIVNYWIESLTNSSGLFSKPIEIKNPHTNLNFKKHNLYNIYFKLINAGFTVPLCITAFFKADMDIPKFSYCFYTMLKEKTIENFANSNLYYDKWEQIMNMLHEFRKDIDYITFTNHISYRIRQRICKELKNHLNFYLKYKFSCNPLIQRDFKMQTKDLLKKYLIDNPDFGYERGQEIMRYIPPIDRPRRRRINPPPPPQILVSNQPSPINISNTPPTEPPPPPPVIETTQPPSQLINPFAPSRELPRSPAQAQGQVTPHRTTISNTLSLFRR